MSDEKERLTSYLFAFFAFAALSVTSLIMPMLAFMSPDIPIHWQLDEGFSFPIYWIGLTGGFAICLSIEAAIKIKNILKRRVENE